MMKNDQRNSNNTLRNKIVPLLLIHVVLLFLVPTFVGSQVIPGWYSVAPWEVEMCTKYGGPVYDTFRSQSGVAYRHNLQATTFTLQFSKTQRLNKAFVYEGAWYLQPVTGTIHYALAMVNASSTLRIAEGDASAERPITSYWIKNDMYEEYAEAELTVEGMSYRVPIICTNC